MRNNLSVLNIYKKKSTNSKIVTQLLFGENFKKIKKYKSWIKIKNNEDNYEGYIKNKKFPLDLKNTHKVSSLCSNIYSKPNNKNRVKMKLSFGSKIKVLKKSGNYYKFEKYWIKRNCVKKISFKSKNIFHEVTKFKNIKYKWGGKSFRGIDCSALVQLFFNFNNKFCPRDTEDQIKYFKKKISLKNVAKNDLIFWKGHVALAISKKNLIHAYGPLKKVVIMPIIKTITRIHQTADLKVIGVRRIQ